MEKYLFKKLTKRINRVKNSKSSRKSENIPNFNILDDPIVKLLAIKNYKIINKNTLQTLYSDKESSSGSKSNLMYVLIKKPQRTVYYFKKHYDIEMSIRNHCSKLPIQELIASNIYRIVGCKAPKNKVFLNKKFMSKKFNKEIETGSKKVNIIQWDSHSYLDKYIHLARENNDLNKLKELSKLLATVLCIGDNDRNLRNYYTDLETGVVGKFDNDRTFENLYPNKYMYADPDFLIHVKFIEKLACREDVNDGKDSFTGMYNFKEDRLFKYSIEKKTWEIDSQFFNDKTIDIIKNDPINTYMFIVYINTLNNLIKMPEELKKCVFSPKDILGDAWNKIHEDVKSEINYKIKKIYDFYNVNINNIQKLIEIPLGRMKELENMLIKKNITLPNIDIDYGPILKYIKYADENKLTLNEAKHSIRRYHLEKCNIASRNKKGSKKLEYNTI